MADETIHLLKEGSLVTVCCRRHAMDERLKLGTYDPAVETCSKSSSSGSES